MDFAVDADVVAGVEEVVTGDLRVGFQQSLMVRETCHHKLPLGVAGGSVDVGNVGAGGKVADVEVSGGGIKE